MNDSARSKNPRLKPGIDIRSLPLSAVEGFVLSRIDGTLSEAELPGVTGLDPAMVEQIVTRLAQLGAIECPGRTIPPAPAPPSSPSAARSSPSPGAHSSAHPSESSRPDPRHSMPPPAPPGEAPKAAVPPHEKVDPAAAPKFTKAAKPPLYDPKELEEDVDLDVDRRKKILDTFYTLDKRNHYQLLGVAQDAEKKVVRKAYFDLAKVFHPDTMFRKRLGAFKTKMEVIFKRITEAYELLNKQELRAEYDAYLKLASQTSQEEDGLAETERLAESVERGDTRVSEFPTMAPPTGPPPAIPAGAPSSSPPTASAAQPTPPASEPAPPSTPPTAGSSPPPAGVVAKQLTPEERKRRAQEMMQRRLLSATGRQVANPAAPPKSEPPKDRNGMIQDLTRSLRQVAGVTGGTDKASRQIAEARRLEAKGDLVGAANAFRLAVAFAPDRPEISENYERLRRVVAIKLADSYAKQAEFEEKFNKPEAAAISWSKVCEGRPHDPHAHRRVADCLLAASGDMRKAQKYAQLALEIDAKDSKNHRTLGRVYLAAGLRLNAKRELETAAKLDPNDDLVKNLIKELKDGP